jgi:translation initiation factor IF-3
MQHHTFEKQDHNRIYLNEEIYAYFPEVRAVGSEGENLGIMKTKDAIEKAYSENLDLIIVSAKARPPVAKIMDYGRFTYEQKKKNKEVKKKSFVTETKSVQIKIGTGTRDKLLKVDRIEKWLIEGHRVKIDLFLWGRYKYMDASFLTERLQRFLLLIRVPFKLAEAVQKTPKGFGCTLERDKNKDIPPLPKRTGKEVEEDGEEKEGEGGEKKDH